MRCGSFRANWLVQGKGYSVKFGKDFFNVFNFAIQIFRLFIGVFGDEEDRAEVEESKKRSASPDDGEVL